MHQAAGARVLLVVPHICGHTAKHFGPYDPELRRMRLSWMQIVSCRSCLAVEGVDADRLGASAHLLGLPPLRGSMAAVRWAECIRARAVLADEPEPTLPAELILVVAEQCCLTLPQADETLRPALDRAKQAWRDLRQMEMASWWIEHRQSIKTHVIDAFAQAWDLAVAPLEPEPESICQT